MYDILQLNDMLVPELLDIAEQQNITNAETLEILKEKIATAKFVLWNGPLGNYEQGFIAGTVAISRMLAESSAKIIVGGGDTLAAVSNQATKDQISYHGFISTAGGAMLDFLATGTLPGIEALK